MNVWLKYGQVLNDPVRNLNIRLAFQSSNVTDAQLARGNITTFDVQTQLLWRLHCNKLNSR